MNFLVGRCAQTGRRPTGPAMPAGVPAASVRRRRALALAAVLGVLSVQVAVAAEPALLPPERAFRLSARALDDRTVEARFAITDGYYLYRDKMHFALAGDAAVPAATELPAGKMKRDEFFGDVETYRGTVVVRLTLANAAPGQSLALTAQSQGCADVGVCYPPTQQKLTLALPSPGKGPGPLVDAAPVKKNWFN